MKILKFIGVLLFVLCIQSVSFAVELPMSKLDFQTFLAKSESKILSNMPQYNKEYKVIYTTIYLKRSSLE